MITQNVNTSSMSVKSVVNLTTRVLWCTEGVEKDNRDIYKYYTLVLHSTVWFMMESMTTHQLIVGDKMQNGSRNINCTGT